MAGIAAEIVDKEVLGVFSAASDGTPPGPFHLFRIDLTEVSLVRVGDPADHLMVESWHPGRGLTRVERR